LLDSLLSLGEKIGTGRRIPMKREVAAELVDSLKEAGVDFVATLTEANLHELVMALGEDKSAPAPIWAGKDRRW
jgi:hypothetical protein